MPEITQTVTGSVGLDPATTSWVLPLALWAGGVRRREKRRKLTGRRSCPDGNPQFLPLNPEGLLEKGALGELGRGGIPRHRGAILSGGFSDTHGPVGWLECRCGFAIGLWALPQASCWGDFSECAPCLPEPPLASPAVYTPLPPPLPCLAA